MPSATGQTPSNSFYRPALPTDPEAAIGIYVHWPFCEKKCPYCDFNSHVRGHVDQDRWRKALLAELDYYAERTVGLAVESIFFGGGTPSLMPAGTVEAIIDHIAQRWSCHDRLEVTLEANPSSVEAGRFNAYRQAGVNRLSLGVQALDDDALRFLGRLHDKDEALRALDIAQKTFHRYSFDLIYARPGQSLDAWREELDRALQFSGGHLSAYQLTIEEDTAFYRRHARGEFALPDEDLAADLYLLTEEMTRATGLLPYEISNYARPGEECRHNLIYWLSRPYIGVGPGAHGRLRARSGEWCATEHRKRPEDWLCAVEEKGHGALADEPVNANERAEEAIMMGLRLSDGIDKAAFLRQLGMPVDALIDGTEKFRMIDLGFLEDGPDRLRVTQSGRLVLNSLIVRLLG